MRITAHPRFGLPYGSYPRLVLAWLTTEVVRTRSPELELGQTFSSFMAELGLTPTGGRWGTISRLRDQIKRLFTASVWCLYEADDQTTAQGFQIAEKFNLWWEPQTPEQAGKWRSTVTLGSQLFDEIPAHPIPIDSRALRGLKRSPMAVDIYCWLTYRMSYLKKQITIPWEALQMQFGADYPLDQRGLRHFREAFIKHLRTVQTLYPKANMEAATNGLTLCPSPTHVVHRSPGE